MSVFSRALVALTCSDSDRELLRYAAVAARAAGCGNVVCAHVLPADHDQAAPHHPQSLLDDMRNEALGELGRALPASQISFEVAAGPRIDQLLGLAVAHQSEVIILGHRKERSGRRSLARRLAMVAPCSVWLVPEGSPDTIENILVPTDFSEHSADALSVATALAQARGLAECSAVHVYFDPSTVRYDEHVAEVLGQEEAAFERFFASTDTHGVKVLPVHEESTNPPQAILRVAERLQSDLIVMNTRGRTRSAAILLGSVTSGTMAATSVPLLAVKHFGARMSLLRALQNHRFWEGESLKTN